jgi:hypothetical protein
MLKTAVIVLSVGPSVLLGVIFGAIILQPLHCLDRGGSRFVAEF